MRMLSSGASKDLAEWTAPVVIDVISGAYGARLAERPQDARAISLAHFRIWRHLLAGECDLAMAQREGLRALAQDVGLEADVLLEADREVLLEVIQCVLTRFQRSPQIACGYTLALVDAASSLAQERAAA
jgi:hypothetical protein